MPAEWETHSATWLTWPRRDGISFPEKFEPVPAYWVKMCELLSPSEEVHINYFDEQHLAEITGHLQHSSVAPLLGKRIHLHHFPAREPWCRDHGPIFVVRESAPALAVVDWRYNAWGGKYPPFDQDDEVPVHVSRLLDLPLFQPQMVLEGGSIEVNGHGCLLTTTSCLLHPNRNPNLSQEQIEGFLKDYLGVSKILWIGDGIQGDDTDGHVDDITRFVNSTTIVTCIEDDPADPNFQPLMDNYEKLLQMTDTAGDHFRVCTLPMPHPIYHGEQRLPASYANFYIGNEVVIVPV